MPTPLIAANNYVAISRRTLDVEDYIDLLRRHAGWIVGPTLFGLVVATVVAFVLQNVYVSTAVMRITPPQISQNIVASTINQQLTERINQMEQEILSRTSLSSIIQDPRLDLYKSERASKPLEDVIEAMRAKDIRISIIEVPGGFMDRRGASAFSISFSYPDPKKAQQVVQTLMTRFQEASITTQTDTQKLVTSFVHDELSEAKANLAAKQEALTKFRIAHPGELPEEEDMNIAQLNAAQQQAATVNDALNRLAQEKLRSDQQIQTLQGQMELMSMMDKESEVATAAATPQYRMQNEKLAALNRDVSAIESQLAMMRLTYKATHPDIRAAEDRLNELRRQRDAIQKQQDAEDAKPKDPVVAAVAKKKTTNYDQLRAAQNVQGQIEAARVQEQSLQMERQARVAEQQRIAQQIKMYQDRLAATSSIAAQYSDLVRDEKTATDKLQSQLSHEELTEQNHQLLERKAGEQLEVVDTPNLPEKPTKPNRLLVVGVGFVLSFMVGLAMAGVQEARDTSLKNLKDVRAYTNLPVLSSIPLLENSMLVRRKRRLAYLAWSAGVILGIIAVTAALYYHITYLV